MNAAAIQSILTLINSVLPLISNSSVIGQVLTTLEQLLPTVVQEGEDLVGAYKNILADLQTTGAATADQIAAAQALDAKADADFDAAVAAYNAAHPQT